MVDQPHKSTACTTSTQLHLVAARQAKPKPPTHDDAIVIIIIVVAIVFVWRVIGGNDPNASCSFALDWLREPMDQVRPPSTTIGRSTLSRLDDDTPAHAAKCQLLQTLKPFLNICNFFYYFLAGSDELVYSPRFTDNRCRAPTV